MITNSQCETIEAEEINAPEAKRVEACVFQTQEMGSSPIWSTGFKWQVEEHTVNIDGRNHTRLRIKT